MRAAGQGLFRFERNIGHSVEFTHLNSAIPVKEAVKKSESWPMLAPLPKKLDRRFRWGDGKSMENQEHPQIPSFRRKPEGIQLCLCVGRN
jgi:hypothetical protein